MQDSVKLAWIVPQEKSNWDSVKVTSENLKFAGNIQLE